MSGGKVWLMAMLRYHFALIFISAMRPLSTTLAIIIKDHLCISVVETAAIFKEWFISHVGLHLVTSLTASMLKPWWSIALCILCDLIDLDSWLTLVYNSPFHLGGSPAADSDAFTKCFNDWQRSSFWWVVWMVFFLHWVVHNIVSSITCFLLIPYMQFSKLGLLWGMEKREKNWLFLS